MSLGHPYFNRDVGMQNYSDYLNGALQNQAMQSQLQSQLQGLGVLGGGGYQSGASIATTACVSACVSPSYSPSINRPAVDHGYSAPQAKEKGKSMFKEVTTDIKNFILEHRGIIYFIVAALVVDNLFFKGAFKARLQAMADRVVTKVEEKIQ